MKEIILIGGDLAAGKTTLSKRLAKDLNIIVINKDIVKEILGDNIGFTNREENLKLSHAVFGLFKYLSQEFMEKGISFILESNFREYELRVLEELIKKYGYKVTCIVLEADIKVLHKRFLDRISSGNRNPVHKAVDLSSYDDFEKSILEARKVNYFGNIHLINTNDFNYNYDDILKIFKIHH